MAYCRQNSQLVSSAAFVYSNTLPVWSRKSRQEVIYLITWLVILNGFICGICSCYLTWLKLTSLFVCLRGNNYVTTKWYGRQQCHAGQKKKKKCNVYQIIRISYTNTLCLFFFFFLYCPILENSEIANIHAGRFELIKTSCSSCSHLEPTIFGILTYIITWIFSYKILRKMLRQVCL